MTDKFLAAREAFLTTVASASSGDLVVSRDTLQRGWNQVAEAFYTAPSTDQQQMCGQMEEVIATVQDLGLAKPQFVARQLG